jgi:hypothetical protein
MPRNGLVAIRKKIPGSDLGRFPRQTDNDMHHGRTVGVLLQVPSARTGWTAGMGMVEGEEFATELTEHSEGLEQIARVGLVGGGTGQSVGQRKKMRDNTLATVDAPGEQTTTFLRQSPSSMIHQLGMERFGDQQLIKRSQR